MNLLERLRQEVLELHLESEEEIVYHFYRRTGEIFDYNPRFDRLVELEKKALLEKQFELLKKLSLAKKELLDKEIDIENVEEFEIICTTWAKAFVKLLNAFGIEAKVVQADFFNHVNVLIKLKNGFEIIADLMIGLEDISRIKLGMGPKFLFYKNEDVSVQKKLLKIETNINHASITDEVLEQMKLDIKNEVNKELSSLNVTNETERTKLAKEIQLYKTFQKIELIMSTPRPNIRYSSGFSLIGNLLTYFLGKRYLKFTEFYDLEKNIFILVYSLEIKGEMVYFCYQETRNGWFEFHEITKEEVEEMQNKNYNVENDFYLKLEKKKNLE